MVLQKMETVVNSMLSETIMALCRNVIQYDAQFSVEGLLGITIDQKQVCLVNINEIVQKEGAKSSPSKKRRRKSIEKETNSSDSESSSSGSDEERKHKKRKRKHKKRDRNDDNNRAEVESTDDNTGDNSRVKAESDIAERLGANDADDDNEGDDYVVIKEEPGMDSVYGQGPGGTGTNMGAFGFTPQQAQALTMGSDMSQSASTSMMSSSNFQVQPSPVPGGSSDTDLDFWDSPEIPKAGRVTVRLVNRFGMTAISPGVYIHPHQADELSRKPHGPSMTRALMGYFFTPLEIQTKKLAELDQTIVNAIQVHVLMNQQPDDKGRKCTLTQIKQAMHSKLSSAKSKSNKKQQDSLLQNSLSAQYSISKPSKSKLVLGQNSSQPSSSRSKSALINNRIEKRGTYQKVASDTED